MSEIKRTDYPALYENGKGKFLIVPDWRSGPVGFFRSKKSLEEYEAEQAALQAAAVAANQEADEKRAEKAREEGAAVRVMIEARERAAQEALAKRKAAEPHNSSPISYPDSEGNGAGAEEPPANPLAGFLGRN